jgi:hypothetical protein
LIGDALIVVVGRVRTDESKFRTIASSMDPADASAG